MEAGQERAVGGTLHSYFTSSATRSPAAPAVQAGGRIWSYRELWALSEQIAASLAGAGNVRGQTVGVLCHKGGPAYAAALAVMAGGNTYVPLNPKFPVQRLHAIAAKADLMAVVVDDESAELAAALFRMHTARSLLVVLVGRSPALLSIANHRVVMASTFAPMAPDAGDSSPSVAAANVPAYLLFTSGSTGEPKGVPVLHSNARACIDATSSRFPIHQSDRLTQFSELTFDLSIAEMFLCWKAGACLVAPTFTDTLMAIDFVRRNAITVWISVPTLANNIKRLGGLLPESLSSLRLSLFCGEALPVSLAASWQRASPHSVVVNLYGPTEAAIFATSYVYREQESPAGDVVPLGSALDGVRFRLAGSDHQAPPPAKKVGELLLAGPQVVSGYWRDPSATAKSFIGGTDGERWYRTGDLVSMDAKDGLVFHGRVDQQIKVRGYRVELLEVESILRRVTGSELVAVVPVRGQDLRCEDLVAFCSKSVLSEREILSQCRQLLPGFMVPSAIFPLGDEYLNDNGKIDYPALSHRAAHIWTRFSEFL